MDTDPITTNIARDKVREMLLAKPFQHRWEPLSKELSRLLLGRPENADPEKTLPEYCHRILELWRRTLFGCFPEIRKDRRQRQAQGRPGATASPQIDWGKLGVAVGIGQRAVQFFEQQVATQIEELKLEELPEFKAEELLRMLFGSEWLNEFTTPSGQGFDELLSRDWLKAVKTIQEGGPAWDLKAYEAGPAALAAFKSGSAKGATGFQNVDGSIRGERKLRVSNTYTLLLLGWPEIGDMIRAQPPRRMVDLWEWLAPFSYAGWIEIQDLDQLVSLCRPIGLKLKKPGAPRKPGKC